MHPDRLRPAVSRRLGLQVLFDFDDIAEALRFAAAHGFGVLELNLGNLGFSRGLADARTRRRVRSLAGQLGIRLAAHAIEGSSLFVPDRSVMRNTVRTVKRLLDRAESAGIENVVMHLGFEMFYACQGRGHHPHEHYPEFYEQLIGDALADLKEHAAGRARLCIENVGGFRFGFVHRLLDRLLGGNLGLCYDIGHNAILAPAARRTEAAFYARHRRLVFHSHLHDNQGRQDEHLVPGQGTADLRSYLRFLLTTPALLVLEVRPKEAALAGREHLLPVLRGRRGG